MARPSDQLLLTCEHGGNRVPPRYRGLFAGQDALLATHRGYDIGALEAARRLSRRGSLPLMAATVTRLLVDLNRSPGHPRLFSSFTRGLPAVERERILAQHYRPYRERVAAWIADCAAGGAMAIQVSVHSFAASLDGRERACDIGLLYDPGRPQEAALCGAWQSRLRELAPGLTVRRNYPYRGVSDGLVTFLRRRFRPAQYAGIELEINQALALGEPRRWRYVLDALAATLPAADRRG